MRTQLRIFMAIIIVMISFGTAYAAPTITITSLNEPNTFCPGQQVTISWTALDLENTMTRIDLSSDGGLSWLRRDSVPKANLEYIFTMPTQVGTSYRIRIINATAADTCDGSITILLKPVITTQVAPIQNHCNGSNVSFNPVISPTPNTFTYRWLKNGNQVPGVNTPNLTLNNIGINDAGIYVLEISGGCSIVTSDPITLSVFGQTVITQQPQNYSGCTGAEVLLSLQASGGLITYQWKRNGVAIANATRDSYTISSLDETNAGSYTCVVTGLCGAPQTSSAANVTVLGAPITALNFTNDSTVCTGTLLRLEAHGTNGNQFTYIWKKNGSLLTNTDSALIFDNVTIEAAGTYSVAVKNDCNQIAAEKSVKISVYSSPGIFRNTNDTTVYKGYETRLRIVASGDEVHYQWKKDGVNRPKDTLSVLSISATQLSDTGYYQCVITNRCGTFTSDSIKLSVVNPPAGPKLTLSQNAIEFGCVDKGTSKELAFDGFIKNTGEMQLSVSSIKLSGTDAARFSIVSDISPFNLNAGESRSITVKFSPTTKAINTASLVITSNSTTGTNSETPLAGTSCFEEVNTNTISVGTLLTNTTKDTIIKVCNSGTKDMSITAINLNVSTPFSIKNAPILPKTVESGKCLEITLSIASTKAGTYNAELAITTAGNGLYTYPLSVIVQEPSGIIESALDKDIILYPNPADNVISITSHNTITFKEFSIVTVLGTEIARMQGGRIGSGNVLTLSLESLPQGSYTILGYTAQGNVISIPMMINR